MEAADKVGLTHRTQLLVLYPQEKNSLLIKLIEIHENKQIKCKCWM